jgi:hypothetical protein
MGAGVGGGGGCVWGSNITPIVSVLKETKFKIIRKHKILVKAIENYLK